MYILHVFHCNMVAKFKTIRNACSKWQTKDQPVVVEEALAVDVDAVGVVLGGEEGEESQRTRM